MNSPPNDSQTVPPSTSVCIPSHSPIQSLLHCRATFHTTPSITMSKSGAGAGKGKVQDARFKHVHTDPRFEVRCGVGRKNDDRLRSAQHAARLKYIHAKTVDRGENHAKHHSKMAYMQRIRWCMRGWPLCLSIRLSERGTSVSYRCGLFPSDCVSVSAL